MKLLTKFIFTAALLIAGGSEALALDNYLQKVTPIVKVRVKKAGKLLPPKALGKIKSRINDGRFDESLSLKKGKATISFSLPRNREINTIRIAFSGKDFPASVKVGLDNSAGALNQPSAASFPGPNWFVINRFRAHSSKLVLKLSLKKLTKITEIEAWDLRDDFNGDGFGDLVIGAPLHDAGGALNSNFGRVSLYLGGPAYTGNPALTFDGDETFSQFGRAITPVGDVNGDFYSDFLVGAHAHDANGAAMSNRGRAYLYFGGPSLDATPDLILNGEEDNSGFGNVVTGLGDINRDGFDDFAISAPNHSGGGLGRGRVEIFLGGSTPSFTAARILDGDEDAGQLGYAMSGDSDVNNDGFPDLLIGAPFHNGSGMSQGRSYLYLGGSILPASPSQFWTGDEDEAHFGDGLGLPGDVNGDGFDDILIGASGHDAGQGPMANRGRAYLYFGGVSIGTQPQLVLDGEESDGSFGRSFGELGDINRDGYADFIVGAPFMDLNGGFASDLGRAYLYYGGSVVSSTPGALFSGSDQQENFGRSISRLDIFAGEGYSFAIGAPGSMAGGSQSVGAVEIYEFAPQGGGSSYILDGAIRDLLSGDEPLCGFGAVRPLVI